MNTKTITAIVKMATEVAKTLVTKAPAMIGAIISGSATPKEMAGYTAIVSKNPNLR